MEAASSKNEFDGEDVARAVDIYTKLVRDIEVSHWGNVQITEHYKLIHGGAQSSGEFSRLDYQARGRGPAVSRNLIAKLPARAHSIYYRDAIGNISTSNIYGDMTKISNVWRLENFFQNWIWLATSGILVPVGWKTFSKCLFWLPNG